MKQLLVLSFLILISPKLAMATCFEPSKDLQNIGQIKSVLSCFENKINQLEKEKEMLRKQLSQGGGKSITINAVPGLPEPQVSMSKVVKKFKLDLLKCKRKSSTVVCLFRIANGNDDVNIALYRSSRAFDQVGKEYKPGLANIADVGADLSSTSHVLKHLISGVPMSVDIEFNGIPRASTQFTALNIVASSNGAFTFKFRNVAIID